MSANRKAIVRKYKIIKPFQSGLWQVGVFFGGRPDAKLMEVSAKTLKRILALIQGIKLYALMPQDIIALKSLLRLKWD